jgi:hypothetical protein
MITAQEIRDPIHRDIILSPDEIKLLDTWQLQRLRGVKQLDLAYLVYPGAVHTRFEHSLGTRAIVQRIIESSRLKDELGDHLPYLYKAALLHDIGQPVFSHIVETLPGMPRHERMSEAMISGRMDKDFRDYYKDASTPSIADLLNDDEKEIILDILSGRSEWECISQLLRSSIDADLLDYLWRDAHYCGVPYGYYDDRIFSLYKIEEGKLFLSGPDAIPAAVDVLEARLVMRQTVYNHHTVITFREMLLSALEDALGEVVEEHELYLIGDAKLLDVLRKSKNKNVIRLVNRIDFRKPYKRAYLLTNEDKKRELEELLNKASMDRIQKLRLISDIARESNKIAQKNETEITDEDILISLPKVPMYRELSDIVIDFGGEKKKLEWISSRLQILQQEYENLWTFYVFSSTDEKAHIIHEACKKVFVVEGSYDPSKKGTLPEKIRVIPKDSLDRMLEEIEESPRLSIEPLRTLVFSDKWMTRDDIAKELGLAKSTVSFYLNKILELEKQYKISILSKKRKKRTKLWLVDEGIRRRLQEYFHKANMFK